MKKRLTASVMALTMVAALGTAGCGSSAGTDTASAANQTQQSEASGTTTGTTPAAGGNKEADIRVTWWGNQVRNEVTDKVLAMYKEEHPGVSFESEFTDFGNYWSKLATLAASNSLQDVMQMNHIYLGDYARNGLLLDLTPYIENGTLKLDNVSPNMVEAGTVDGKVYAVSLGANAPSLIYNADVVAAAGLEVKDNMSIDEFAALSKTIYKKTGMQTNIAYGVIENFVEYYARDKGYILFEKGKLGVPDETVFVDFFELYKTAHEEGWQIDASHFVELSPGTIETDPLVTGKSWVYFGFSNQLEAIINAAPDVNFGITTWPADNPAQANYVKPALFFAAAANSESPEHAVGLIDYFTNSISANEVLLAERGVPVSSVVSDAIKPLLAESKQREFEYLDLVREYSSPINPSERGKSSEVNILMNNLMERLLYGQISAQEAALQLFEEGNEIMAH